uniref:Uncharacterized protein n=2 Tax=unclassified Candidatus Kentrum TaxID=2643149 RepID=A0A451AWN2_9GAMM|nr:MAG: hypothetical protein BECKLPF1236A_GA0070988_102262 [Candidatus Kentron sp. LPFa]VFK34183.1 MAG: hypothetical protein BECKLPF1236C_GA0070990_102501 [Candidatus Kentron sp. LPFa]VFK61603.1 MAG: hypothetical protein BECKUNK1418G_GA0071005_101822 [Candidatus Kentron sp. UNK]VFK70456.1 MAG: hypothetical protein BECKUNK1418H_GA0071006_102918 [Candidatus Kentron sp. UNK]
MAPLCHSDMDCRNPVARDGNKIAYNWQIFSRSTPLPEEPISFQCIRFLFGVCSASDGQMGALLEFGSHAEREGTKHIISILFEFLSHADKTICAS